MSDAAEAFSFVVFVPNLPALTSPAALAAVVAYLSTLFPNHDFEVVPLAGENYLAVPRFGRIDQDGNRLLLRMPDAGLVAEINAALDAIVQRGARRALN